MIAAVWLDPLNSLEISLVGYYSWFVVFVDSSFDVIALSSDTVSLSLGLCLVFATFLDRWDYVAGSHWLFTSTSYVAACSATLVNAIGCSFWAQGQVEPSHATTWSWRLCRKVSEVRRNKILWIAGKEMTRGARTRILYEELERRGTRE